MVRPIGRGTKHHQLREDDTSANCGVELRRIRDVGPRMTQPVALGSQASQDVVIGPHRTGRGWVLRTELGFDEPIEVNSPSDSLLYEIARAKPGTAEFERLTSFRPSREGSKSYFSWTREGGWGEIRTWRIGVRDLAGNETSEVDSSP